MSNLFEFVKWNPNESLGSVVVGFVIPFIVNLRSSFALTLVVPEKLIVTWIISGLVDILEHDKRDVKAVTPTQVIVPEGAMICVGKVTLSKSPFFKVEDAVIDISKFVVAALTKLFGEIATLLISFTDVIVTVTPEEVLSIS